MTIDPQNQSQDQNRDESRDAVQDATWRAQVDAARAQAVAVLTQAARIDHPREGRLDFAEFVVGVLASVAANVGSTSGLLAGWGSRESDHLGQLIAGAVGPYDQDLVRHRSEPVRLRVSIDRLLEVDLGSVLGRAVLGSPYWVAAEDLDEQFISEHGEGEWPEHVQAESDRLAAELRAQWIALYTAYGEVFTAAVQAEADALAETAGLAVPVEVKVVTDPEAVQGLQFDESDHSDQDALGMRLWQTGRRAVLDAFTADQRTGQSEQAEQTGQGGEDR
jgi:hypothetical protein